MKREKLQPLLGKRLTFRGLLNNFNDSWSAPVNKWKKACVRELEYKGEVMADHVWIINAPSWERFIPSHYDKLCEFEARVIQYERLINNKLQRDYCLSHATPPRFIELPALKVPRPSAGSHHSPRKVNMPKHNSITPLPCKPGTEPVCQSSLMTTTPLVADKDQPIPSSAEVQKFVKEVQADMNTQLGQINNQLLTIPAEEPPFTGTPTQIVKETRRFIKACGGSNRAIEALTILQVSPLTMKDLLSWVEALEQ